MEIWGRDNIATHNAYHMGKVCYTEDNILVYNLYVSSIPLNADESHIKQHFNTFGEIKSTKIVKRRNIRNARNSFRYAFVHFKLPESAAMALKNNNHYILGVRVKVKAADSWKQPKKQVEDDSDIVNNVPPNSILNLNDDCLLYIFSFLKISEKLKMSEVCDRFQNIFEMTFKIEKKIDLNSIGYLTLMEMRQIVTKVGHLIEHISFSGEYLPNNQKRFIELIPSFCKNLKELHLRSLSGIYLDTFRRISNLKYITKLELINCDITDHISLYLSRITNIESLNLSGNYELTGTNLNEFKILKYLTLNNCPNIDPYHFSVMCKKLQSSLLELNLKNCDQLTEESFNLMSTYLINLQKLTISTNYRAENLSAIANLKYLKNLTIYCQSLTDDLFINLANKNDTEHTIEKLCICGINLTKVKKHTIVSISSIKELHLSYDPDLDDNFLKDCGKKLKLLEYLCVAGCSNITKNGVLTLLKLSENLKTLDISNCIQFSIDLIHEAIDILNMKKKYEPLKLIIGRTKITESDIEEDPKYAQNQNRIKLSFNYTKKDFVLLTDTEDEDDDDDDDDDDDLYSYDPDFMSNDDEDDDDFYDHFDYFDESEYDTDGDLDNEFYGFHNILAVYIH